MRPSIHSIQEAVELFLNFCRPRGRKLPESQGPTLPCLILIPEARRFKLKLGSLEA